MVTIKFISALEKVFREKEPTQTEFLTRAYHNEEYDFQMCLMSTVTGTLYLNVDSAIKDYIEIKEVKYIAAECADYEDVDDYRIFTDRTSTFYPDKLDALNGKIRVIKNQWRAFWVTIKKGLPAGDYSIRFTTGDYYHKDVLCVSDFKFSVTDIDLGKLPVPFSCWMYYDVLCKYYDTDMRSERFWEILSAYFTDAVAHGINTAFIQLFSHAIEGEISDFGEVFQLVGIDVSEGNYKFDFTYVEKFIDVAIECGVEYFELSHLGSQQGAKYCPPIVATKDGRKIILFDKNTSCTGEKYYEFLEAFLPELNVLLRKKGVEKNCFYHVSDEPQVSSYDNYVSLLNKVRECVPDANVIDALNDETYAKEKSLTYSVVGTQNYNKFHNCKNNLWVYYCCDQCYDYLSNRFFNFPSLRTRVIGVQLYLTGVKGFLHWSFNYWKDSNTGELINPDYVSDAHVFLPAGDTYLVYPGKNGVINSLREELIKMAIRDYRALRALEEKKGRSYVMNVLKEFGFEGFTEYSHDESVFTEFENKVMTLLG